MEAREIDSVLGDTRLVPMLLVRMAKRRPSPLALCLLLLEMSAAVPLMAQTPDGRSFRVNSTSRGNDVFPRVAMDSSGRAVVLWAHIVPPRGVLGQVFDPQGLPVLGEFAC